MPYKDPARKKEWERFHRPERLARRRELREREVSNMPDPEATLPTHDGVSAFLPLVGGFGLAAYQPKLAVGVGSLALIIAAAFKKGPMWWIFGAIVLVLGILFLWIDPEKETNSESA
jgi:cell division protein FtsW (lipid II flippase)